MLLKNSLYSSPSSPTHSAISHLLCFPDVGGYHRVNDDKLGEWGEEFFESLFGHVREIPAVAFTFELPVFEGGVEVAAFLSAREMYSRTRMEARGGRRDRGWRPRRLGRFGCSMRGFCSLGAP